jgi:hypothetical protein
LCGHSQIFNFLWRPNNLTRLAFLYENINLLSELMHWSVYSIFSRNMHGAWIHKAIYFHYRKTVHFCIIKKWALFSVCSQPTFVHNLDKQLSYLHNSHDGKDTPQLMEVQINTISDLFIFNNSIKKSKQKVKQSHYKPDRPWEFQEVQAPRLQDNQHLKVVSLSALHTRCFYTTGNIPVTHFCHRLSQPRCHSAVRKMKNPTTLK